MALADLGIIVSQILDEAKERTLRLVTYLVRQLVGVLCRLKNQKKACRLKKMLVQKRHADEQESKYVK